MKTFTTSIILGLFCRFGKIQEIQDDNLKSIKEKIEEKFRIIEDKLKKMNQNI